MRGPTKEAKQQALGILMSSISQQNEIDFSSFPRNGGLSIEQIDLIRDAMRVAAKDLVSLAEEGLVTMARARNAVKKTINKLPPEILEEIFEKATLTTDQPISLLCILNQVCTRWYSANKSSPRLWTNITSTDGLQKLALAFKMSKQLPLNYESYNYEARPGWKVLEQLHNRMRRCVLHIEDRSSEYWRLEATPQLLHYHLQVSGSGFSRGARLPSNAPRLQILGVEGCSFYSMDPFHPFPELKKLYFDNVDIRDMRTFLGLLKGSPLLETMIITNSWGESTAQNGVAAHGTIHLPVSLPNLRQLVLEQLSDSQMRQLVVNIRVKPATVSRFSVEMQGPSDMDRNSPEFSEELFDPSNELHMLGQMIENAVSRDSARHIALEFHDEYTCSIAVSGIGLSFRLSMPYGDLNAGFGQKETDPERSFPLLRCDGFHYPEASIVWCSARPNLLKELGHVASVTALSFSDSHWYPQYRPFVPMEELEQLSCFDQLASSPEIWPRLSDISFSQAQYKDWCSSHFGDHAPSLLKLLKARPQLRVTYADGEPFVVDD